MSDIDWTDPTARQKEIDRIVGERVSRAKANTDTKIAEYERQVGDLTTEIGKLRPLADSASRLQSELNGIRTRAERDKAYPAAFLTDEHAPIRERIERLYDAEEPGADGNRPAFADWIKSDPLASRLLPAAPSGAPPSTPAGQPPTSPARGTPPIAPAANPAHAQPVATLAERKAHHARLIGEGKIDEAKTYRQEHIMPKAAS